MLPNGREDEPLTQIAAISRVGANGALAFPTIKHIKLDDFEGKAQALDCVLGIALLEVGLEGGFHEIGLDVAACRTGCSQKTGRIATTGKGHGQARGAGKEVSQGFNAHALAIAQPCGIGRKARLVVAGIAATYD